jgi:hypothetical protein
MDVTTAMKLLLADVQHVTEEKENAIQFWCELYHTAKMDGTLPFPSEYVEIMPDDSASVVAMNNSRSSLSQLLPHPRQVRSFFKSDIHFIFIVTGLAC